MRRWSSKPKGQARPASPVQDSRPVESVIRPYLETDEPDVVRLSLAAWAPVFAPIRSVMGPEIFARLFEPDWRTYLRAGIEGVLRDDKTTTWVAEAEGAVMGFVAAVLLPEEGMGEIQLMAVDPDHQNHGLGTELTNVATDWIRAAGMPLAKISTGGASGHAPARRTYEKAGYTPYPIVDYFRAL
jgi:GNAT superfamily N-acetyltransferase